MKTDRPTLLVPSLFPYGALSIALLITMSLTCGKPIPSPPTTQLETPPHPPFSEGLELTLPLLSGVAHEYPVPLALGDAVRIVAVQQDVDVTLTLLGPQGEQIAWMDSPNYRHGTETLAAIARIAGVHQLRIEATDGDGTYRLRIARLGPATAQDRAWAEALALWVELRTTESSAEMAPRIEQALASLAELKEPLLTARFRRALGLMLKEEGHLDEAIFQLEEARRLVAEHGSGWEMAPLLADLGDTYLRNEDLARAEAVQLLALAVAIEAEHTASRAVILSNLAVVHHMRGDWQQALSGYRQAIELGATTMGLATRATWLYNLGMLYENLGDADEGQRSLEQALRLYTQLNDLEGQGNALAALAWIHQQAEEVEDANAKLDRALEIARQQQDLAREVQLLEQRASQYLTQGRLDDAETDLMAALERTADRRLSRAYLFAELGAVRIAQGQLDEAIGVAKQALATFQELGIVKGEISVLAELARAEKERGQLAKASEYVSEALEYVESRRGELVGADVRRTFFASRTELFDLQIAILIAQDRPREAFNASERARARVLLDLLQDGLFPPGPERQRERELRRSIRQLEEQRQLHLDGGHQEAAAAIELRLRQQLAAHRALQSQPTAMQDAPSTLEPLDLEAVQQRVLGSDSQLLVYHLGEDRSVLWLIGDERFDVFDLPPGAQLDRLALRLHELLKDADPDREASQKRALDALSQAVLGPVAGRLYKPRLIIVTDGALQIVPFASLPYPATDEPLLAQHELVSLPSASVVARLRERRKRRSPPTKILAMIADPVFQPNDPRLSQKSSAGFQPVAPDSVYLASPMSRFAANLDRLPFAGQEADAILAMVNEVSSLRATGFAANLDLVTSGELASYQILHFATHGRFAAALPALSGLFLSRYDARGEARNSMLSLLDLFHLELPADLVVLSACETALGHRLRGEGVVGPSHGFFAAGASRLIASYWRVDDEATAVLMGSFYRGLLEDRLPPAEALRRAQLGVREIERWRAPYFWAGFALHGDWHEMKLPPQ